MNYFFGVIGYPAKHSKSPWIHNHFLKQNGNEGIYRIFETPEEELPELISALKTVKVDGFNVTVPYKEKIVDYLDELDPYAELIGAVNTVHVKNGKWIGYNTDGKGYVRSVKEAFPNKDITKMKALIIGAGGAARGIYRALVEESLPSVDLCNRTLERGRGILQLNNSVTKSNLLSLQEAEVQLGQYDLIVQTTSVGMSPNSSEQILSLQNVNQQAIVSDIVYKPFETSLLKDAKQKGANILHGHGMLIYQAALAHEIWTSQTIQAEELLEKFKHQLKGEELC